MSGWMISFLKVVTVVYVIIVRLIFLISAPPFYPTILAPGALKGMNTVNEPRSEKTGLRGFRPGPTQTRLYSHRR